MQTKIDIDKMRHSKADFNLLRNQNMHKWFKRRSIIKT